MDANEAGSIGTLFCLIGVPSRPSATRSDVSKYVESVVAHPVVKLFVFQEPPMSAPFQCTVVTPEAQLFDEEVASVVLPAHDGKMGVLAGHAPMMIELGTGPLTLSKASGGDTTMQIDGGFAQVQENQLTVLADRAEPEAAAGAST
jgi:F-type H+-transporting ATPase subunit epsilon